MIQLFVPGQPPRQVEQATPPTLKQLQDWVGGWIEHVAVRHDKRVVQMFINEEGKLKGMPYNTLATRVFRQTYPDVNDVIVGTAVILTGEHKVE